MLIPVKKPEGPPFGLLVFEPVLRRPFRQRDISMAQAVADLCWLSLKRSKMVANRERMIKKLEMLSEASDFLLSEFENKPLQEKFDFIVEQTTKILDAEMCSFWLVKRPGKISLETSFLQEGKVNKIINLDLEISEKLKKGLTGYIAAKKKVFNCYGEKLRKHPAIKDPDPPEFVPSQQMYSELAYPLLDENKQLIGLLIAYNKLDATGKPYGDRGFSKEFDEPLMQILTTKLKISLKNAAVLKKLRNYELIVESTPDPVVITDTAGIITYMNQGAKDLFGNLEGRSVVDFYPSDDQSTGLQKARETKRKLLQTPDKRLRNYETEFMSEKGEIIPISLSLSLLPDDQERDGGIIGIAKDLREVKALVDAGQYLLGTHETDEILQRITLISRQLKNAVRAYIKLYDKNNDCLVFRSLSSKNPLETFPLKSTPKFRGMTGYVFKTQKPYLSKDVSQEPEGRYFAIYDDVRSKVVVPITYFDKEKQETRQLGVLSVDSDKPHAFSVNDMYFLSNLANQAASALENASLIASKNRIIDKLRAFYKVQQAAAGKDLKEELVLESVLDAVVDILGFSYATISRVDSATQMIGTVAGRNVPDEFLKSAWHPLDSKDIQAWVVRHKMEVCLKGWDERLDSEIYKKFEHERYVRVIIPIISRGQAWGTLEAGYDKSFKPKIEQDEIDTLRRIVSLAGMGIDQATLVNQLMQDINLRKELETQLEALNQASVEILNATTEQQAINYIFQSLKSIGYTRGMLSLVDVTTGTLEGRSASGENWKPLVSATKCALSSKNILAQALRNRDAILSKNCAKDPWCEKSLIRKAGIRSQYVIPLIAKEKAIGTLQIDLTDFQDMVHGDRQELNRRMRVVETFARQIAIAIRNIQDMITIDRLEANIAETAHEFRSPLHNIMTQVGGLKEYLEQVKSDKNIGQMVGAIEEEINRAKRQMDNTLLLSKEGREELSLILEPGFIQEVIKSCSDSYRLRCLERGLRIIIKDNVLRLPKFLFDRDLMSMAITNLIDNAVK
ncbi:MAG: GAF domain-containing protein, partial [Calditrichaeota bacterium]